MPYKNIVFVKLEKRLLNDPRWWTMSESAQLTYIKLILLAAETYNKIPLNDSVLREAVRSKLSLEEFQKCLEEIKKNFPKFQKNKHVRYFLEFDTKTNYLPKKGNPQEIPRKSQGLPKEGAEKDKEKEIDKEEDKDKNQASPALLAALDKIFKDGFNIYALINQLKKESKVGAQMPEEVLLRVCEKYWQQKTDIKTPWPWFCRVISAEWVQWNAARNIKEGQEWKKQTMPQSLKEILSKF